MIDTYVETELDHELSANIIDLCPVGALNNKPFRYHARAWEMTQRPLVSPHDGFGTNIYAHVLRGRVMRVVPRENEEINETWIADRDRFGFEGMYSQRARDPAHGARRWRAQDGRLGRGAERGGRGAEEGGREPGRRELGVSRLAAGDAWRRCICSRRSRAASAAATSTIGCGSSISRSGRGGRLSQPRHEDRRGRSARRRAHRRLESAPRDPVARASHPQSGACAARRSHSSTRAASSTCSPSPAMVLRRISSGDSPPWCARPRPRPTARCPTGCRPRPSMTVIVPSPHRSPKASAARFSWERSRSVTRRTPRSRRSPQRSQRCAARAWGCSPREPNAAGAYLAGAVPHREPGGAPIAAAGLAARAMLESRLKGYMLLGGIDPAHDLLAAPDGSGAARPARRRSGCLVVAAHHLSESLRAAAHVVLPIGTFAEGSGTFVNVEGRWQSWAGAAGLQARAARAGKCCGFSAIC